MHGSETTFAEAGDGAVAVVAAAAERIPLSQNATVGTRVLAAGLSLGCLVVLCIAAWLKPNPAGYGSHTTPPLRMQSCAFMDHTGLPCPSCGMTTSFTWFARGNLAASVYVQPMGALLALLVACTVWGGAYVAITGRPVYRLLRLVPGRYVLIALLAWALIGWGWKMFIHLNGWDGWR